MSHFAEPSLAAYFTYCLNFCARYFIVAGGIYCFFHIVFRQRWLAYRIQTAFPSPASITFSVRWAMVSAACTGLSTLLLYGLVRGGETSMYFEIGEHGWLYLGLSVVLGVVGYDTWFYWYHRLLHTRWLFENVHEIHHRATNPTAFAAYAAHPIETFMGDAYFILFALTVPIHPLAFAAVGLCVSICSLMLHSGYELSPRSFVRRGLHRCFGASTHHNMHHQHVRWNYGSLFNWWDRLMGTNHPEYEGTLEAIAARRA
jgi:sterol desaturase/sphingolipid hydroxylase (fatty acid hydroxylase superfamily)